MTVKRYDLSALQGSERTPQGFLRVPVYATRTGVFKYRKKDGSIRRELRLPEEVFKKASMDSLASIPLTKFHPKNMVDTHNAKLFTDGFTGETVEKKEDKFLSTHVTIMDQSLINDVLGGAMKEVSCGYNCDLEETSGVWQGEPYDCIQRNIVYNHLAVVPNGRAGSEVRLRLDSNDAVQNEIKEGDNMNKIKIDGAEFECSPELQQAFDAFSKKIDGFMGKKDSAEAETTKVKKEMETLQGKFDALEVESKKRVDATDIDKQVDERVKSRLKVLGAAKELLPTETKFDELTDRQLKEEVIKKDSPAAELKEKSEAYIDARFDSICENIADKKAKLAGEKKTVEKKDEDDKSSEAARKRQTERTLNAWKPETK